MDNETPKLDSRTSAELVEQAKNLIPQFTPEYTNFNDSDPGMTLVKVHAWLTETLLYQINQLPQQNYDKFIDLLGVKPKLATSASTDVAFSLKKSLGKSDAPLLVNVPLGSKIEVDDPELEQPIVFETDRSLSAVNAAIGAIVVPHNTEHYSLKTEYNAKNAEITVLAPFKPFANIDEQIQGSYVGLVLRPHQKLDAPEEFVHDRWPECEINLTVVANQLAGEYFATDQQDDSIDVEWAYYNGEGDSDIFNDDAGWTVMYPQGEAIDLGRSGHLSARLPAEVKLVQFEQLPRSAWKALGALKPPLNMTDFLEDLNDEDIGGLPLEKEDWLKLLPEVSDEIVYDDLLTELLSCCSEVDVTQALANAGVSIEDEQIRDFNWLALDPDIYATPSLATTGMVWLRVKPKAAVSAVRLVDNLYFNTVAASAKQTFRAQKLGMSDGKPNQVFKLPRTPLLFDNLTQKPLLSIISVENDSEQAWQWAVDFYQSESDSQIYTFDAQTQSIQFGDGIFGAIPNAGVQIFIEQMQVGGGLAANVGQFTLTKLKRAIPDIDSVTNPLPASGGRDTESFKQTRLRAAHEIKHRDRAVTADDFAELACQTPTVAVHAAYALANKSVIKPQPADDGIEEDSAEVIRQWRLSDEQSPGAVTVVVLPQNNDDKPYPTEAELKAVYAWLNPKRLITTQLFVIGPDYRDINLLSVEVSIHDGFDVKAVSNAIQTRLLEYFHPVSGGKSADGWPFGENVYVSDVFCQILDIEGVSRAFNLNIEIEGVDEQHGVFDIEGQQLVSLKPNALDIKVNYEH